MSGSNLDSVAAAERTGQSEAAIPPMDKVCKPFRPTCEELLVLARHWLYTILDVEVFWFLYAQTGGSELRLKSLAESRLEQIAKNVGREAVLSQLPEAEKQIKLEIGERYWDVFKNGDSQAWASVREEIMAGAPNQAPVDGAEAANTIPPIAP